jgi:hypothetical protein
MLDDHNRDRNHIDIKVQRLIEVQIKMRWALVIFLWLTIGTLSLWSLRADIALWIEYFTWAAVRVAIRNDQLPFMGLGLCVAMTLSTLIRQSWDILYGISKQEYQSLVQQVQEIENQGRKHLLWQWVIR